MGPTLRYQDLSEEQVFIMMFYILGTLYVRKVRVTVKDHTRPLMSLPLQIAQAATLVVAYQEAPFVLKNRTADNEDKVLDVNELCEWHRITASQKANEAGMP